MVKRAAAMKKVRGKISAQRANFTANSTTQKPNLSMRTSDYHGSY
jgi:hypothetical protein